MTTRILVAKYVPDVARWEPKNIGVVITDGTRTLSRFVGESASGTIDGRHVRFAVGAPTDTYREWVKYWRRMITEGHDLAETRPKRDADFFVVEAGETFVEPSQTLEDRLSTYFSRLVEPDVPPQETELREAVEELLLASDVASRVELRRDIEVPAKAFGLSEPIRFAYGFKNGHEVVGQRVPLGVDILVHDALFRFIAVGENVNKVAFIQTPGPGAKTATAVEDLGRLSVVVDVADPDASRQLDEALSLG